MKRFSLKLFIKVIFIFLVISLYGQETESPIYMDFRNQKISDIIYSIADVCSKSVIIDETVTGNDFNTEEFLAKVEEAAREGARQGSKGGNHNGESSTGGDDDPADHQSVDATGDCRNGETTGGWVRQSVHRQR